MSVIRCMSSSDAPHRQILPIRAIGQRPYSPRFFVQNTNDLSGLDVPDGDLLVEVLPDSERVIVRMPREAVDDEVVRQRAVAVIAPARAPRVMNNEPILDMDDLINTGRDVD